MWESDFEVDEMFCQSPKLPADFCWYCHLESVPSPVTEAVMVSLPLPAPAAAAGLDGLPGLVRNAEAAASSFEVEQLLLLYAL